MVLLRRTWYLFCQPLAFFCFILLMLNGHHSNKQQPIDETSNNNYIISYRQFIKNHTIQKSFIIFYDYYFFNFRIKYYYHSLYQSSVKS